MFTFSEDFSVILRFFDTLWVNLDLFFLCFGNIMIRKSRFLIQDGGCSESFQRPTTLI